MELETPPLPLNAKINLTDWVFFLHMTYSILEISILKTSPTNRL